MRFLFRSLKAPIQTHPTTTKQRMTAMADPLARSDAERRGARQPRLLCAVGSTLLVASCWQLSSNDQYRPTPVVDEPCPTGQARESYGGQCIAAVEIACGDTTQLSAAITESRSASAPTLLRLEEGCTYSVSQPGFFWGGPTAFDVIQRTVYIEGRGVRGARIVRGGAPAGATQPNPSPFRFFVVDAPVDAKAPNAPKLVLINVERAEGLAQGGYGGDGLNGGGGGGAGLGGAIFSMGSLVLDRVTLLGNQAQGGAGGSSLPKEVIEFVAISGGGGGMGGVGGVGSKSAQGVLAGGGGGFRDAQGPAGGVGAQGGEGGRGTTAGSSPLVNTGPGWDRQVAALPAMQQAGGAGGGALRLGGSGGACGQSPSTAGGAGGSGGGGGGGFGPNINLVTVEEPAAAAAASWRAAPAAHRTR